MRAPLDVAGYTFTGTETRASLRLPLQIGRAPPIERLRRSSDLGRRRVGALLRAAAAAFGLPTGLFAMSYRLAESRSLEFRLLTCLSPDGSAGPESDGGVSGARSPERLQQAFARLEHQQLA